MRIVPPTGSPAGNAGCSNYQQMCRRRWLQGLATSAGVLPLTSLAERLAQASDAGKHARPRSMLLIWLQGGPSQLETFDPHAGSWIGGEVRGIQSSIPGVLLADTLPATAEQLRWTTLVRSVVSQEGDHERATYHVKTGWRPDPTVVHPSIGAIVCHQSPENLEIPRHVSILPTQWPARGGFLGPSFDAFQIGDPAEPIPNLTARVEPAQLDRRIGTLLQALESEFQRGRLPNLERERTLHQTATTNAVTMMNSEQLVAFDVTQEARETRERFGETPFGRSCLAAIRLLDAGVRCVEVELSGWDSHINNHALQTDRAGILDQALAATLQELVARDLIAETVLFCGGEFGRTPRINPAGGRDHWPHGFSVLLAGGRFRRGHVHGSTAAKPDRAWLESDANESLDVSRLTADPLTVPDLHATLLEALGINPAEELLTPIGRPLRRSDGRVIKSLLT